MSNKSSNIPEAIGLIETCERQVSVLLAGVPVLQAQAKHVMTRLCNSLKVASGASIEAKEGEAQPLTHIFGVPIRKVEKVKAKDFKPTLDALTNAEFLAKQVLEDVESGVFPADILDKHSEIAIRAAGAMVGLHVTATDPERITGSFIADIFNKMADDQEQQRQVAEAKKAAEQASAEKAIIVDEPEAGQEVSEEIKQVITDRLEAPTKTPLQIRYDEAVVAVALAEAAKAQLPADANAQTKGSATKVLKAAQAELELVTTMLKEQQ